MFKKLLLLTCIGLGLSAKTLIWDLGDVLVTTSWYGMANQIGAHRFLVHTLFDWQTPNVKNRLFEVLRLMDTDPDGRWNSVMSDGSSMPPIMCRWMAGLISGHEIIKLSYNHIEKLDQEEFFISGWERDLIQQTIATIFDPQKLVATTSFIPAGIALLNECKKARDENGNPHQYIILSNWEPTSFALFVNKHPEFFELFDGIVVSGHIGMNKPDRSIYDHLLTQYKLDPQECIFIDDNKKERPRCT